MNILHRFLIAATLGMLTGLTMFPPSATAQAVASSPAEAGGASQPAQVVESTGQAILYVINDSGPTLIPSNQDVTDNGTPIASLPRQTYIQLNIAAGHHEFRFKAFPSGRRVALLDAKAGDTYYLLVAYSPGRSWALPFGGDPMTIRLIDAQDADPLMKAMKPQ